MVSFAGGFESAFVGREPTCSNVNGATSLEHNQCTMKTNLTRKPTGGIIKMTGVLQNSKQKRKQSKKRQPQRPRAKLPDVAYSHGVRQLDNPMPMVPDELRKTRRTRRIPPPPPPETFKASMFPHDPHSVCANLVGVNSGDASVILQNPYEMASRSVKARFDPAHNPPGLLPDPNTAYPTQAYRYIASHNPTIHNGGAVADGAVCFLFRGDPSKAWCTAGVGSGSAISYEGMGINSLAGTVGTTNYMTRLTNMHMSVRYVCNGDLHSVRLSRIRVPTVQWSDIQYTNWPTYANVGVNATQIAQMWGEDRTLDPTNCVYTFSANYPSSTAAYSFTYGDVERALSVNNVAWDGELWWIYGLRSTDQLSITMYCDVEYFPVKAGVWLDPSSLSVMLPAPKAAEVYNNMSEVLAVQGAGSRTGSETGIAAHNANIAKAIDTQAAKAEASDTIHKDSTNLLSKVADFAASAFGSLFGQAPARIPIHVLPGVYRSLLTRPQPLNPCVGMRGQPDEEKTLDEQPIILTPVAARRPSLAQSVKSIGARRS